ncbi:MAG: stearoyl-CoA 9-desaturase oxidoreductase [Mycobacterium sp.]|nr:stearoyl-CoA 9-desaturase oxidoreductase [Mycobacterium sp.]
MTSLIAGTARRPLRSLAQMVTQPLVPRDFIDLIDPLSSSRDLRGRIDTVTAETADAATIRIRVGRGWRGHRAGQYVRVGVDVDGVRQWRTYSVTSHANAKADRFITITVKTVTDGVVSNYLVRRAKADTLVHLDQACGDFTLPDTRPAKVLFVTAGSGITPVMGMLRSHSHELGDVVVVHSAPTADDVVFGSELRALADTGAIRLVEHHTATSSRITAADLDALVPDWADRQTWACGPAALLDDIEAHWARHDAEERLHTERFTAPAVGGGDGGPISFTRTGSTIETSSGTTLLDAGENAGVLMPSGCRMGVCFGCVLPLRNGAVRDVRNGEVTIGAPDAGVLVQTCITTVAGSCEIDI